MGPTYALLACATAALVLLPSLAGPARGESYPSRAIKIIVPLAAGGMADMLARVLAQHVTEATGQAAVVENRTGAGGASGVDAAAKAAPDGYTLFLGLHSTNVILPYLGKLPFDPDHELAPIIHIATLPNLLVVHPGVPANSVAELIAHAKANPGKLAYASQGNGSSGHMTGEQFKQIAGVDIVHVPYRGAAPAIQDLVGGQVQMMFDSVMLALPQLGAGKTRALAVTSAQRVPAIADVATMGEAGLPEVQGGAWFGLFAPARTPPEAIEWLNREVKKAYSTPEIRQRFLVQGTLLPLGSPEEFAAFIALEKTRWGEVIRRGGIKLE
jgi:tripartite-type tricarboxylate transporter receptor subunit TctC